jgi:hypothetical protein
MQHVYAWTAAGSCHTIVEQEWDGIDIGFANTTSFA